MTKFYVTSPIYYVNDVPHIGHAYTTIAADTLARYHRLKGDATYFLTGTDEHGQNIARAADRHGETVEDYTDRIAAKFKALWSQLDISYDDFIRTTEPRHIEGALKFWEKLLASGDVYRDTYAGWYCQFCEAFYDESELLPGNLDPVHKRPAEWVEESNYFFRLSAYQTRLQHLIENTGFVQPETRRREILGVLRQGLRDFSISRQHVRWGIPIPGSPDEVFYVWVDALSNYITALDYAHDSELYHKFWPGNHLVGKDIIRFHCLYWPAMLMAAGEPIPEQVFAHGYITKDGEKLSKTTGNIIDPVALTEEWGADPVRYFFMKQPFGSDWNYTDEAFIRAYNADLADQLGNLLNRTVSMVMRYYAGQVPAPGLEEPVDTVLVDVARGLRLQVDHAMEHFAPHEAIGAIWELVSAANKYVDDTEPWNLAKARKEAGEAGKQADARLATVLYNLVESLRLIAIYISPLMPTKARGLTEQLGITLDNHDDWEHMRQFGGYPAGSQIKPGAVLFPKKD
ncbi:MAG: methionine--tRNA ligase [Chloroflexi bacterium]|nr:methionine--tRNA ligase [Chloroflexota bacterium]